MQDPIFVAAVCSALCLARAAAAGPNTLSSAERAAGYELLWDGTDLKGWRLDNYTEAGLPADSALNWAVTQEAGAEKGAKPSADPDSNVLEVVGPGKSLFTADTTFLNFDWIVEWQTPSTRARSSLIYSYSPRKTDVQGVGMIYPIMNALNTAEWATPLYSAGCLYELVPLLPSRKGPAPSQTPTWTLPDGRWNQSRIIVYGNRAAHYGNGLRLLEYDRGSKKFYQYTQLSHYATYARVSVLPHPASLLIQDHGQRYIKFRSVKLKRLTENPWAPGSPYLDRDSVAAGDTVLVDKLGTGELLFPKTVAVRTPARTPLRASPGRKVDLLGRDLQAGSARPAGHVLESKP